MPGVQASGNSEGENVRKSAVPCTLIPEPRGAGAGHLLGDADALAGHPGVASGDEGLPLVAADEPAELPWIKESLDRLGDAVADLRG